ncbi:MAG: hypothetical protein H7Y60_06435 [Rhodospirillaceae bacterium]|nr:hypothetical protein [Rhodospirillales bacterium]
MEKALHVIGRVQSIGTLVISILLLAVFLSASLISDSDDLAIFNNLSFYGACLIGFAAGTYNLKRSHSVILVALAALAVEALLLDVIYVGLWVEFTTLNIIADGAENQVEAVTAVGNWVDLMRRDNWSGLPDFFIEHRSTFIKDALGWTGLIFVAGNLLYFIRGERVWRQRRI